MKLTRLFFGFLLIVGSLPAGGPSPDTKLTAPTPKDSPSLSNKPRSSASEGPMMDSGRRSGIEDTVQIVSVREEKPDAGGRRKVTVQVHYVLVHYAKGVLNLGFNLKSAAHFAQLSSLPVLAGEDEVELSAMVVPVAWPKAQPFKLSVSLSAEPHPGQWSLLVAVAQPMKPIAVPAPRK